MNMRLAANVAAFLLTPTDVNLDEPRIKEVPVGIEYVTEEIQDVDAFGDPVTIRVPFKDHEESCSWCKTKERGHDNTVTPAPAPHRAMPDGFCGAVAVAGVACVETQAPK